MTLIHTCTHACIHTRTHARSHARTLTHARTHTHTRMCTHTHSRMHAHARTHTRTHARTHARTHTETKASAHCDLSLSLSASPTPFSHYIYPPSPTIFHSSFSIFTHFFIISSTTVFHPFIPLNCNSVRPWVFAHSTQTAKLFILFKTTFLCHCVIPVRLHCQFNTHNTNVSMAVEYLLFNTRPPTMVSSWSHAWTLYTWHLLQANDWTCNDL